MENINYCLSDNSKTKTEWKAYAEVVKPTLCMSRISQSPSYKDPQQKNLITRIFLHQRFCEIIILFGTTCKSNAVRHASYHFTIFLHFAIEIKNKEQIYNFSESSKSRMRLASRSLATPGICRDITPILDRSADYREKRSSNCMADSRWAWNILPQNIFNATNEGRISIKCCCFAYFDTELLMWRKKTSILLVQVMKKVVTPSVAYLCKTAPMAKFKCAPFLII